jgi:hypothetical protein
VELTHKPVIRAEADRIQNTNGVAEVAGIDGDELDYLLGKVARARRIDESNWCPQRSVCGTNDPRERFNSWSTPIL